LVVIIVRTGDFIILKFLPQTDCFIRFNHLLYNKKAFDYQRL